jgi:hypothetical protein
LLGLVAYRGRWERPESVASQAQADTALRATLAEYNARRDAMAETAEAHFALADWCEKQGLKPESIAHFTAVTRLSPARADAWMRLGCKKYGNRWLNPAEYAAETTEAEAQKQADAVWLPRLKSFWRDWLAADEAGRAVAEVALAANLEPRAVRSIHALFSVGTADQQRVAARLLGQVGTAESSRELVRLSALGRSPEVRRSATESIARRDPNEVIEPLIALLRDPVRLDFQGGVAPTLIVEDETTILNKTYVQQTIRLQAGPGRMNSMNWLLALMDPTASRSSAEQLQRDIRSVGSRNAARVRLNNSVQQSLKVVTGQDLGSEPESWKKWWGDQKGFEYVRRPPLKRTIKRVSVATRYEPVFTPRTGIECFAAGTPVQTLFGPRPIEDLKVGDRLLSQDASSGALGFQPLIAVYHNPPTATVKLTLEAESAGGSRTDSVVATPNHRFWLAGKGWVMARDLKAGDTVRTLGGKARVAAVVASEKVQPVFNLEVAGSHSFFVGGSSALVHDNSEVKPTTPFDAPPTLTTLARAPSAVEARK